MENWGFWLLVVLVGLMVMAGRPVESQPLVTGAAALITFPLGLLNASMSTGFGLLLAPLAFIAIAYYLKNLHFYLGTEVIYFIVFAALLIAFMGNPR